MLVNQLKNSMMLKVICELLSQWCVKRQEDIPDFKFKTMPFLCQVYHLAPSSVNKEIIEIFLSDSQNILKCKIFKQTLIESLSSMNPHLKYELQLLNGAFFVIHQIKFSQPYTKNSILIEIIITQLSYIDGLGSQVVNQMNLQKQKHIVLNSDCSNTQLKQLINQIRMQEFQNQKPILVYDATKYPQDKHHEQQFKQFFQFENLVPSDNQFLKFDELPQNKLRILSNVRKVQDNVPLNMEKSQKL